jgi:ATP-dependent Lon protease
VALGTCSLTPSILSNLGTKEIEVGNQFVKKFEKLLARGIWCIITLRYFYEEGQKGSPFLIEDLKPIQMPKTGGPKNKKQP